MLAMNTSVDLSDFTVLLLDSATGLQVDSGPGQQASAAVLGQFDATSIRTGASRSAPAVELAANQLLLWLTVLPGATRRGTSYCLRLQGVGADAWGSSSAVFTMDSGPLSGSVTVSPLAGQAAFTVFSLTSSWFASASTLPLSYIFFKRQENSTDQWSVLGDWSQSNAVPIYLPPGDWEVQASAKDVLGLEAETPVVGDTVLVSSRSFNASSALSFLVDLQADRQVLEGTFALDVKPSTAPLLPGFRSGGITSTSQLFGGVPTSAIGLTLRASRRLRAQDERRLSSISVGYTVSIPSGAPVSSLFAAFANATLSSFSALLTNSLASAGVVAWANVTHLPQPALRGASSSALVLLSGVEALITSDTSILYNSSVVDAILDCLAKAAAGGSLSADGATIEVGILYTMLSAVNNTLPEAAILKATDILDMAVYAVGNSSRGLQIPDAQTYVVVALALMPAPSTLTLSANISNASSSALRQSQRIANIVEGIVYAVTKSLVTSSSACSNGFAASIAVSGLTVTVAAVAPIDQAQQGLPMMALPSSVYAAATASSLPNPCGSKIGMGSSRWASNPYGPSTAPGAAGRRLQQQNALGAVVSLSVTAPDGSAVAIRDLTTPIGMVIPLQSSTYEDVEAALLGGSHPECRWWDKSSASWSTAGCRILGMDSGGTSLLCACTHLTPFGNFDGVMPVQAQATDLGSQILAGLLAALLCANVKIYTSAGFQTLRGMVWSERPSAIIFAVLLAAFFLGFVAGSSLDILNSRRQSWKRAEAERGDGHDNQDFGEEDEVGDLDNMSCRQLLRLLQSTLAELRQCRGVSLLRIYNAIEAKYLREVACWRLGLDTRTFLTLKAEEAHLKVQCEYDEVMAEVRTAKLLAHVDAQTSAALQELQAAALKQEKGTQITKDISLLRDIHKASGHFSKKLLLKQDVNGIPHHVVAWLLSSYPETIADSEANTRRMLRSLQHSCSDSVDKFVDQQLTDSEPLAFVLLCRGLQLAAKVVIIAWASHPIRDIICTSVHFRHVGRTFLLVASQMMGATCSCIFFSATQGVGVDSPPGCTAVTGIAALVQTLLVQIVSVLVGIVCATWFLMLDENHRSLRKSKVAVLKAFLFYFSAVMLFVFFAYTVSSFIANTTETSAWQWVVALLLSLLYLFALTPLLGGLVGALLWPLGSSLMVGIWRLRRVPVNFEDPAAPSDSDTPDAGHDMPPAQKAPMSPRDELLDLPVELLEFYETLEVLEKEGTTRSRVWSDIDVPKEPTPDDLPEHVQAYLESFSPRQVTPRDQKGCSRSRSPPSTPRWRI